MMVTRYIQERGVRYESEDGSWWAELSVSRTKDNPGVEVDLLKVYVGDSERSTTTFVDDDYPGQRHVGLTAFEAHLRGASPGRFRSKFSAWS